MVSITINGIKNRNLPLFPLRIESWDNQGQHKNRTLGIRDHKPCRDDTIYDILYNLMWYRCCINDVSNTLNFCRGAIHARQTANEQLWSIQLAGLIHIVQILLYNNYGVMFLLQHPLEQFLRNLNYLIIVLNQRGRVILYLKFRRRKKRSSEARGSERSVGTVLLLIWFTS